MKWIFGCHKNFFKKYKIPHKQTKKQNTLKTIHKIMKKIHGYQKKV